MPASSCGAGVAAESDDAEGAGVDTSVSSSSSSSSEEAVGFGLVTGFPYDVTVFVVPSGEVTVEVVVLGDGVGAASTSDSGAAEINAARSKEINLFLSIIISLPPFINLFVNI